MVEATGRKLLRQGILVKIEQSAGCQMKRIKRFYLRAVALPQKRALAHLLRLRLIFADKKLQVAFAVYPFAGLALRRPNKLHTTEKQPNANE